jgi:heme oxygenase
MAAFRTATRDLHMKIDSDPRISGRLQSRKGLADLLGRWYGFLRPYEDALSGVETKWRPLTSSRRKTQFLVADLSASGIRTETLPLCRNVPSFENEFQMFGSMYVTEGSTLGGRFLARHIEKSLGLTGNQGYSFFDCYGEHTMRRWQEFGELVEDRCADKSAEAIPTAISTFDCIHRWLVGA